VVVEVVELEEVSPGAVVAVVEVPPGAVVDDDGASMF
jgi:hypothetical protein